MQRVIPALRVASYRSSKAFYESLGFREKWTHQFEPGYPTFACEEFKQRGVTVSEPPNNGLGPHIRAMAILDPDNNRLKFLTITDV